MEKLEIPKAIYNGSGIPAWSLVALLQLMPKELDYDKGKVYLEFHAWNNIFESVNDADYILYQSRRYDNPISAVVEIVCWLLETKRI